MRLIPAVILCTLLGIVYWVGATQFTDRIQKDITERSSAAVNQVNPEVDLAVDGRDVTITGLVNTESERQEAKQVVDSVWGVRASKNLLSVRDAYDFTASNNSTEGLKISGTVDTQQALEHMKAHIAPLIASGKIATTARPMSRSGEKLALGADVLLRLRNGDLTIDEDVLRLSGDAEDNEVKEWIESELNTKQAIIKPLKVALDINVVNSMTQACRQALDLVIDQNTVLFEVDKAVINDHYSAVVNSYGDLLSTCPGVLLIEAHTDQDGSEKYNQKLSRNRAKAVKAQLVENGIAAERIQSFSYGETRPIASNETTHDKSYNRRVNLEYVHVHLSEPNSTQQTMISSESAE